MDAQLVLQVPHFDSRTALGQNSDSRARPSLRFATGQGQQDFAATVGDEAFHAGQPPLAIGILPGRRLTAWRSLPASGSVNTIAR